MDTKLLLVDINGTITRSLDNSPFTPEQEPTAIELIPGVLDTLRRFKNLGYEIAGVSNQGGIASNTKTLQSVMVEMQHTMFLTECAIECIFLCPDFEGRICYMANCDDSWLQISDYRLKDDGGYRKPQPGMIKLARNWFGADKENTVMVGDQPEDEQAARAAGVKFVWANEWRS